MFVTNSSGDKQLILFEKHENVVVKYGRLGGLQGKEEGLNIPLTHHITVEEYVTNGENYAKTHEQCQFYIYNAVNCNCQFFQRTLLKGNHLWKPQYEKFIVQNVAIAVPPYLERILKGVTDLKAKINIVLRGRGMKGGVNDKDLMHEPINRENSFLLPSGNFLSINDILKLTDNGRISKIKDPYTNLPLNQLVLRELKIFYNKYVMIKRENPWTTTPLGSGRNKSIGGIDIQLIDTQIIMHHPTRSFVAQLPIHITVANIERAINHLFRHGDPDFIYWHTPNLHVTINRNDLPTITAVIWHQQPQHYDFLDDVRYVEGE